MSGCCKTKARFPKTMMDDMRFILPYTKHIVSSEHTTHHWNLCYYTEGCCWSGVAGQLFCSITHCILHHSWSNVAFIYVHFCHSYLSEAIMIIRILMAVIMIAITTWMKTAKNTSPVVATNCNNLYLLLLLLMHSVYILQWLCWWK